MKDLHPRGFLYQLLRPEFVLKYRTPLSSDAFSGFGTTDNQIHNREVREATRYLLESVIPGYVTESLLFFAVSTRTTSVLLPGLKSSSRLSARRWQLN